MVADAHSIQGRQYQSQFVRISDKEFSKHSLKNGDELLISGKLVSLVSERDLKGTLSVYGSGSSEKWEILAINPSETPGKYQATL